MERRADMLIKHRPVKPTVKCDCGWKGVGIQTQLHGDKPVCPECRTGKNLKWRT
jgi:hypothetical protein